MHANNGSQKNQDFDPFWVELEKYLDEQYAVHEGCANLMPCTFYLQYLFKISSRDDYQMAQPAYLHLWCVCRFHVRSAGSMSGIHLWFDTISDVANHYHCPRAAK